MPSSECEKKECNDVEYQDPDANNCFVRDGFKRRFLYRAWRPGCNDLHLRKEIIATEYNAYILDHSDSLQYGSNIVIRCLPGFMLNSSIHSFVRKTCVYLWLESQKLLVIGSNNAHSSYIEF